MLHEIHTVDVVATRIISNFTFAVPVTRHFRHKVERSSVERTEMEEWQKKLVETVKESEILPPKDDLNRLPMLLASISVVRKASLNAHIKS